MKALSAAFTRQKIAGLVLVALAACDSPTVAQLADSGAAYVPAAEWRTASPAAAGFDTERIRALTRDLDGGRYGTIDGLVVVRYGHLVLEQYPHWTREQAHTLQSVTKSVTSLLFGVAAAKSTTLAVNRGVLESFPRYATFANDDANKRALTLRHLLTMRTSMDFWEQPYPGSPLDIMNRSSGDWLKLVLDRAMTGVPGATWAYNSGAAIVVCGAIREATGEAVDVFARRELFEPLGISGEHWVKSPFDQLPHCGGGLYLKPADLARIGYLVLRDGRWGDKQIVSREWLAESTQPYSRGAPVFFSNFNAGYGYFWWIFPSVRGGSDSGVIAASGSGGQFLFVVPRLDLVVAVVASNGAGLDLLYDGVLAAVHR